MSMKVLIVGPEDLVNITKETAKKYVELELIPVIYDSPSQVVTLIEQHHHLCDILLLTGSAPYLIAKNNWIKRKTEFNKPILYIALTEASIYRVLFKITNDMHMQAKPFSAFSSDYTESEFRKCLDELGISNIHMFIKDSTIGVNTDELTSFHYQLWKENKVQAVITAYYAVYQQLLKLGVPVYRLDLSKSSIENTLQRVLLEGKRMHQAKNQIAVSYLGFHDPNHADYRTAEFEQMIESYGEEVLAVIDWTEEGYLRFVTTREEIEKNTKQFKEMAILQDIEHAFKIVTYLGIGFGHTPKEAELKAHDAMMKAKSTREASCYIVEIDGKVYGPIGMSTNLNYSSRSGNAELLLIAKKAGISIGTLNKLISFCEQSGTTKLTTVDLSIGFGITLRSARRILSNLERHNFAKIIGEEQPINKGRPRQIYKLTLQL
ncbi:hypothetical protein GC102_22540 [Paenibacillus sp. LMG 31460]|uniref:Transcriptional regulator n=1 Tax=Paenibacillus germinis TaxID=2654979 RepID=A0ABX1Z550_9BACL|nr:hypothetical protein [Paenibacillus germinis]NOU88510.1 hypothetical protein [Paenibacillus germinis]